MDKHLNDSEVLLKLRGAGLRPTRQRVALANLMFVNGDRHMTAEALHKEAVGAGISVSLATVYNTLNQFTDVGLLREIAVDSGRSYFDTNTGDHHHFYFESNGELMDIPSEEVEFAKIPTAPNGARIARVDVVVRIDNN